MSALLRDPLLVIASEGDGVISLYPKEAGRFGGAPTGFFLFPFFFPSKDSVLSRRVSTYEKCLFWNDRESSEETN